jgi:hypothetical protein
VTKNIRKAIKFKTFETTKIQKRDLKKDRKDFSQGKYINLDVLK